MNRQPTHEIDPPRKENLPQGRIGFSIYEADGRGYSKWWTWPENEYLGRVDERLSAK